MEWSLFMHTMCNKVEYDYSICPFCGGTGLAPVMCCSSYECGCRNMPVDFIKCSCGLPEITENTLYELNRVAR